MQRRVCRNTLHDIDGCVTIARPSLAVRQTLTSLLRLRHNSTRGAALPLYMEFLTRFDCLVSLLPGSNLSFLLSDR